MLKLAVSIIVVLAGGIAVAYLVPAAREPATTRSALPAANVAVDLSAMPVEERLAALERTIHEERQARQLLQEELVYLNEEVEALREQASEPATVVTAGNSAGDVPGAAAASLRRSRFENRDSPEYRVQRLVAAGISQDRAEWILQREAQIRMSLMEARYEAQRSGEASDYGALQQAEMAAFRNELGSTDYERYLEGTGRPTSVVVGSVLDTSPAQNVGIQPGDEIVSYAGTRVYSMSDLNRAMLEGVAGETVTAQVVRDGVTMQVAIRRGPLGITAGRGRRR